MQLESVPVGVGDPGLPTLVFAQLGIADLDAPLAQRADCGLNVVHLQADVAERLSVRALAQRALEQLDKVALACVEVEPKAPPVLVDKVKGRGQTQPVAVELDRLCSRFETVKQVCAIPVIMMLSLYVCLDAGAQVLDAARLDREPQIVNRRTRADG